MKYIPYLLALLVTMIIPNIYFSDVKMNNSIFMILLFAALVFIFKRLKFAINKRSAICVIPVAISLSMSQVIGFHINKEGFLKLSDLQNYVEIIVLTVFYYVIIFNVWEWFIGTFPLKEKTDKVPADGKRWFVFWLIMIVCWVPAFLAAYPGYFCYDAASQLHEVVSSTYSPHHPLLHTFILGKTLVISKQIFHSYSVGVAIYCMIQMLVITAVFAGVLMELQRLKVSRLFVYLSAAFYSVFPTVVLFGLCTSKDSIFSAILLLHILYVRRMMVGKETFFKDKRQMAGFVITAVIMMLLRNNAIYAYILFVPICFFLCRGFRKQVMGYMGASIFLVIMISKALSIGLQAEASEGLREMLSVPLQQLARAYHENPEVFDQEEKQTLFELVPEEGVLKYYEKNADYVKANVKIGLNSTVIDFAKLWIKIGLKVPETYINATVMNTVQAWYPDSIIDGYCATKEQYKGSETCYFYCIVEAPVEHDSKLPDLYQFYWNISRNISFQRIPVIAMLFSVGFFFQLVIFLNFFAIFKKNAEWVAVNSLILLLCFTCLLGPIVLVRYYLILFFAFPFYLGGTIADGRLKEN